jgi:hypothetical protein
VRPHYSCLCSPGLCSSGGSSGFYLCSQIFVHTTSVARQALAREDPSNVDGP